MAKIKATHRLRWAHQVFYDPAQHLGIEGVKKGDRTKLPAGTHVIPTEQSLAAHPDRFESLSSPEKPKEAVVDEDDADDDGEDSDGADEAENDDQDSDNAEADSAVDEALEAADGDWKALTSAQLNDLAGGYEIGADDIEGSGSGGNVLKGDWIEAIQEARGAAE